jgi:hypothetical protein
MARLPDPTQGKESSMRVHGFHAEKTFPPRLMGARETILIEYVLQNPGSRSLTGNATAPQVPA